MWFNSVVLYFHSSIAKTENAPSVWGSWQNWAWISKSVPAAKKDNSSLGCIQEVEWNHPSSVCSTSKTRSGILFWAPWFRKDIAFLEWVQEYGTGQEAKDTCWNSFILGDLFSNVGSSNVGTSWLEKLGVLCVRKFTNLTGPGSSKYWTKSLQRSLPIWVILWSVNFFTASKENKAKIPAYKTS